MPYQPDQTADAAGTDPNDAETPLSPGGDLLVIDTPGAVLGKHSERLQVRIDRMLVQEAPLFRLRQVVIASRGVQVSSDVIQVCARRGIPLHVLGRWPGDMATVSVPIGNQTVATRRAQFRGADNGLGDTWVRRVIEAKLRTQVALWRYLGKHRREADPPTLDVLMRAVSDIERYADAMPVVGSTPEDVALVAQLGGPGTTGFAEA
ncbi:MAG: CRISPR-associated endonuclease Cas1, partial [Chloroflexi bacterium]|nr:CRISPR-associated endonuclease Cas1 [Chloroflexota bacterium]